MRDINMETKETCSECGCKCSRCDSHGLHLHREIETLKQRVIERDFHILRLETTMLREAERFPNGEVGELRSQMEHWQDRYDRLLESHKKLQRVNQNLEDKLLRIVDKYETDKTQLGQDVANLTKHLVSARSELNRHRDLSERYRHDLHLAIQLLQCKPSTFISRRLETLPLDLQQKVKSCINTNQKEPPRKPDCKVIKVPISTFPPTAMVYAVDKGKEDAEEPAPDVAEDDRVSAAILARVLQEREQERVAATSVAGCHCRSGLRRVDVAVQTRPPHIAHRDALAQPFLFEPGQTATSNVGVTRGASLDSVRPVSVATTFSLSSDLTPARHSQPASIAAAPALVDPGPPAPAPLMSPGSAAAWWASATTNSAGGAELAWENGWDASPPGSVAGGSASASVSVSSTDSGGAAARASAAAAAALRMETRI